MTTPPLAPAGSSSYESDTMTVGDGTWDSSRNTFLLPNLVGLNFETMRYNGTEAPSSTSRGDQAKRDQVWGIDFVSCPVTIASFARTA